MDKEDHLKAMLERAKELKEIGEKLIKESDQLMERYEALKLKKRGREHEHPCKSEGGSRRPPIGET